MTEEKNKKTRVLFANFGRIEKLIFYNLLLDNNFEIVAILTDKSLKELIYFLKLDSNHGKFMVNKITFQKTKILKRLIIDKEKKINVFNAEKITTSQLKNFNIDIVINCSNNVKFSKLSSFAKNSKWTIGMFRNDFKKNEEFQVISFDYNHEQIDKNKNNLVLVPSIENAIAANLTKIFFDKLKILGGYYTVIKGPNNEHNILDFPIKNKENLIMSRSVLNNIIPVNNEESKKEIQKLMNLKKMNVFFEIDSFVVPATTGAIINIHWSIKKFFKVKEINDLISNETNAQIGFSEEGLVSQDVVSNDHYCIIDKTLTKVLNSKGDQIISISGWFDYESSQAISYFRIIQLLSDIK